MENTRFFKYLIDPSWEFCVVENGSFPPESFIPLWSANPARGSSCQSYYSEYALSGIYNSSRPNSFGYRHEEPNSGLSEREIKALTAFSDDKERIGVKRIWVNLITDATLLKRIQFFLKYDDILRTP